MTHPPHHLETIRSHGGTVSEVSIETRAFALSTTGLGVSDIAIELYQGDNEINRARVRKLIEQGRKKSLGAV